MNRIILVIKYCNASINDYQEQLNTCCERYYKLNELKSMIKSYTDIKNHFENFEYKESYKYIGWLNHQLEIALNKQENKIIINVLDDVIELWERYNKNEDYKNEINDYITNYI